jgi:hypothetical protein
MRRHNSFRSLGVDELTCLDCMMLQNQLEEFRDRVDILTQAVTLLKLQLSAMKEDLYGDGVLIPFDRNGDFPPAGR